MQIDRRFILTNRARLERAAEHYLRDCYRLRTAARVSEFASYMRLSPSHLSRVVVEITGQSAGDFLRSRQLTHAAELLRSTPLTARQIAISSAFGTSSTFHRCFAIAFGMTPTQYRTRDLERDAPGELALENIARHPESRMRFC